MRDDHEKAMQKLQVAYDRGFRERWWLELDGRLDPLRDRVEFITLKNRLDDDVNKALAEVRSTLMALL